MNDYGITPEQYHAGLSKLWDALKVVGVQDLDVFTLCAARIEGLELELARLRAREEPGGRSALSIVLKKIDEAIELNRAGRRRCLDADYRDIVDGERTGLEVARGFVKRELNKKADE